MKICEVADQVRGIPLRHGAEALLATKHEGTTLRAGRRHATLSSQAVVGPEGRPAPVRRQGQSNRFVKKPSRSFRPPPRVEVAYVVREAFPWSGSSKSSEGEC